MKNEFEVCVSPMALEADIKKYRLFTPQSKDKIRYSVNDIHYKKA